MTHQQQSARIVRQQLFQQLQSLDVEVVGRFIEDQQVAGFKEQLGQQQTVFLTARERLDRGAGPLGLEQEVLQVAEDVAGATAHHHLLLALPDVVYHRLLGIELLAVLIKVGHFQIGAPLDGATSGI